MSRTSLRRDAIAGWGYREFRWQNARACGSATDPYLGVECDSAWRAQANFQIAPQGRRHFDNNRLGSPPARRKILVYLDRVVAAMAVKVKWKIADQTELLCVIPNGFLQKPLVWPGGILYEAVHVDHHIVHRRRVQELKHGRRRFHKPGVVSTHPVG